MVYKHRFELLRIKKNGETFWGGAIVTRGKYNNKEAVFGSVIDISESKQAEEELKKSEERYKEIVDEITQPSDGGDPVADLRTPRVPPPLLVFRKDSTSWVPMRAIIDRD